MSIAGFSQIALALAVAIVSAIGFVAIAHNLGMITLGGHGAMASAWVSEHWIWLLIFMIGAWVVEDGRDIRWRNLLSYEMWGRLTDNEMRELKNTLYFAACFLVLAIGPVLFELGVKKRYPFGDVPIPIVCIVTYAVGFLMMGLNAFLIPLSAHSVATHVRRCLLAGWAFIVSTIIWWGVIYPEPLVGRAWAVPVVAALLGYAIHDRFVRRFTSRPASPIGPVVQGERNGVQSLSWRQVVGTGHTKAGAHARSERFALNTALALGAAAGWWAGGIAGAGIAAFAGFWLVGLGLRNAPTPDFRGGWTPHTPTARERREDVEPVTRTEDCEAFLEVINNEIHFCIARGDKSVGPLPVVECVPWDSFSNFEEGSHKQWFRPRGEVDDRLDWGVIIAQSNVGRIIRVAESVYDHAGLIELLVTLQNTFITPREEMLRDFREPEPVDQTAQRQASRSDPASQEVPVAPF
jgi:hypothetical protein